MSPLGWVLVAAATLAAFLLFEFIYLGVVLNLEDQRSNGLGYYGLKPAGRLATRKRLRRQALLLSPLLRLTARFSRFDFNRMGFRHEGIAGPRGTCSPATFERAENYQPGEEDIFVATQMKCGTTWMLHVVYQVLRRGTGDLVETGSTLHAVCPWIEGRKTVSMEDAPLIGEERRSRIIKTHFPASHCPYNTAARYIYVARHPVSCFASCADFIRENAGRLAPQLAAIEEWFCSDQLMWWGTWPRHVESWWDLSTTRTNVLFVTFEDMKQDLASVVRRVVTLLGLAPLSEEELEQVLHKCSFGYMQAHHEAFEMHPPQLLAADAEFFVRGSADRFKDVPEATRQRIAAWCAERLLGSNFPLARFYPDVIAPGL